MKANKLAKEQTALGEAQGVQQNFTLVASDLLYTKKEVFGDNFDTEGT